MPQTSSYDPLSSTPYQAEPLPEQPAATGDSLSIKGGQSIMASRTGRVILAEVAISLSNSVSTLSDKELQLLDERLKTLTDENRAWWFESRLREALLEFANYEILQRKSRTKIINSNDEERGASVESDDSAGEDYLFRIEIKGRKISIYTNGRVSGLEDGDGYIRISNRFPAKVAEAIQEYEKNNGVERIEE